MKEDGNAAFKASNWSQAHELYSQALQIDPCKKVTNAKLYFNRATVVWSALSSDNFISWKARVRTLELCLEEIKEEEALSFLPKYIYFEEHAKIQLIR